MREYLGPDHPVVKAVLGAKSPDERARELVAGSSLADPKVRIKLFEGGATALRGSTDTMIALAREVDAEARRLRKIYDEVQGVEAVAQQKIAEARFKIYGTQVYPDATFSLRLSYGAVAGWTEAGTNVEPFTRFDRLYARATGAPPFELPKSWLDAKPRLDMSTRADFVTTNDIVGGNSGSPMVNSAGRIVGLAFDGNIHSIAGSFWFDPQTNRTVGVHPEFIRTALAQVYRVTRLTKELGIQ
jgi:Peptidase S46